MKIEYEVDDGYMPGARIPQSCEVDDEDLRECDTTEEAMELVVENIDDDFIQKITWNYRNLEKVKKAVAELLKEEK